MKAQLTRLCAPQLSDTGLLNPFTGVMVTVNFCVCPGARVSAGTFEETLKSVMACVRAADVEAEKSSSPWYAAAIVCEPVARELVVNAAEPCAFRGTVERIVWPS